MNLASFIDQLATRGRYHFTTQEVVRAMNSSPVAARAALRRLRAKARVAMPFRGFHVNVPPEYRDLGCLPADQFVPQLMEHLGLAYYVGLLSAARQHGAAHQAPMVFQVVVAVNRPALRCGRVRVEFIARGNVDQIPIIEQNTPRGSLRLSTPDATAFDLAGYPGHAGGLSNVATVIAELAEKLDAAKLLAETEHSPLPWTQRLGFLLERADAVALAAPLAAHVATHGKEYVPLRPRQAVASAARDPRWRLLVNDLVEIET